ncbi:LysR substrate-binding domain-containing protein [soil metagenome]
MNLDLSALRTFVASVDLGGFAKAAQRLNRTPGAVSLQMKALEERLGQPVFLRAGKRQQLTPAGETLLLHARRLLEGNDEAVLALTGLDAGGAVRFGMPQDLAEEWLTPALGRFARAWPAVSTDIRVARSRDLRRALDAGEIDVAVMFESPQDADVSDARLAVRWWGAASAVPAEGPVPLLVLDAPCAFRDAALSALDGAGTSWRIALTSSSVSAIRSAVDAGLGVTARTAIGLRNGVAPLRHPRLPDLAPVGLSVRCGPGVENPSARQLAEVLRDIIETRIGGLGREGLAF